MYLIGSIFACPCISCLQRKALVAAQIANVKERFKLYGSNLPKGMDATADDYGHGGAGEGLLRAVMGDSHGLDEELLYSGSDEG